MNTTTAYVFEWEEDAGPDILSAGEGGDAMAQPVQGRRAHGEAGRGDHIQSGGPRVDRFVWTVPPAGGSSEVRTVKRRGFDVFRWIA